MAEQTERCYTKCYAIRTSEDFLKYYFKPTKPIQ